MNALVITLAAFAGLCLAATALELCRPGTIPGYGTVISRLFPLTRRNFLGFAALGAFLFTPACRRIQKVAEQAIPPVRRVAFGSCANQTWAQPIWDVIGKENPDCFLFIGDNVYADTENMADMAKSYQTLGNIPEYARFRSKVPVYATWDDHDYGINDGGMEYPKKDESKKIMLDFFGEPANSERRQRPGVHTSYIMGPTGQRLQIILLDLRWFRTKIVWDEKAGGYVPSTEAGATILGDEQWRWLETELQKPAELRLIASSSQFVSGEHGWEKWANFPVDKQRMLKLLDDLQVRNAFFISGDMHYGELSAETTPGGFTVYDLTSSGMNYFEPGAHYPNSKRLAVWDTTINFGLVEIDWKTKTVSLQVRDGTGAVRIREDVTYK